MQAAQKGGIIKTLKQNRIFQKGNKMSFNIFEDCSDNILNSSDIVSRWEELKNEKESLEYNIDEAQAAVDEKETELAELQEQAQESDSIGINEGIGEMEEQIEAAQTALDEAKEELEDAQKALADWEDEYLPELEALEDCAEELENYCDSSGETLINEDYFTEYCEELVSDIGDLPRVIPSYIEIDWEATAENLKADYSTIEINGNTFYYRAH